MGKPAEKMTTKTNKKFHSEYARLDKIHCFKWHWNTYVFYTSDNWRKDDNST